MKRKIQQIKLEGNIINSPGKTEIFVGTIYSLAIHSMPGTVFEINGSYITIGPTGNFSITCEEDFPLSSIYLISQPSSTITYPTIIDVIVSDEEEGERNA